MPHALWVEFVPEARKGRKLQRAGDSGVLVCGRLKDRTTLGVPVLKWVLGVPVPRGHARTQPRGSQ